MPGKDDSTSRLCLPAPIFPSFLPPFWGIEKDPLVFCFLCPASSFAPMSSNQLFLLCYGRDLWDRPCRLSCWDTEIYFQDNSLTAQLKDQIWIPRTKYQVVFPLHFKNNFHIPCHIQIEKILETEPLGGVKKNLTQWCTRSVSVLCHAVASAMQ